MALSLVQLPLPAGGSLGFSSPTWTAPGDRMTDEVAIMVLSSADEAVVASEWVEAAGCGGGATRT